LLFHIACDFYGWQLAFFRTFGTNALLAYVLHELVSRAVQPFFPKDAPAWYAYSGLLIFLCITWVVVRHMEKQNIFLRV
jgi:fucose 4-O-acetylase-like acetyltransferase